MKDLTHAHHTIKALYPDNPDILAYLNDSFIEPMSELGYKAIAYDCNSEEHILTFEDTNPELDPAINTKMKELLAQGHDDGNDAPAWCYIDGTVYITIPYGA